ncbi:unnamed protein product [Fraxinus pennsylvanica]|uniref:Beta-glucosidase n=1 Tax=Fraxinus pennsylvanica TaxID=56036 RepID=A0AAD1Z849_9LAMI|nr:unnamed protein product [Fraxinus pennsylvanica]
MIGEANASRLMDHFRVDQATGITKPMIKRSDFPQDFVFGSATSAYQVEGAWNTDGKGLSNWDVFTMRTPVKIHGGTNACTTINQYSRIKEDVTLIKKVGLDSYRFSIAWARVLPGGRLSAGINQEGINYYNKIIDLLLAEGIEPCATIFHWDVPQCLEDEYGGFLSSRIVFVAPIVTGDYPLTMRERVGERLPEFSPEQKKLVSGSYDFLGINYYTSIYASNSPRKKPGTKPSYETDLEISLSGKYEDLVQE